MAKQTSGSNVLPFNQENVQSHDDIMKSQSSDGGDDTMKKEYVTHEELNHAVDNLSNEIKLNNKDMEMGFSKLDSKIDSTFEKLNGKIDAKFAEQKLWIWTTIVSVIVAALSILGSIHKFF
ncbi:hemolysin XhlA family protein [Fructilactobacillus cliffordii]|uniref:Hemolysin XhlA family protein n=1 Tax=Fructilactobacillus cliffordii TaxID=2940299 RepID=A0A9Q8ZV89_9LACO|nr:hemolysin XhlA family protein [Fructilactobacillus cliffordii]USS89882.1 hemolysin XhlA family protein [Fructilactobacillus cliffordii]